MVRFLFRKSKSAGRLALSRCGSTVSIASIAMGGDKPRVELCEVYSVAGHEANFLETVTKEHSLEKKRCTALLAPNEYQLMQVDAPSVPEAEIKSAVRWKLKDMLSYPLEQATIDVLDIPPDRSNAGRGHFMYAVAARNEVIKGYMDQADSIGAQLDVIDIPELAQRNIARLLEEEGRGVALLSFNEDGGLLTFSAGGELYHARQIEVNSFQIAAADEEQRMRNFERLVLELQRSLDNFERQFSYVSVTRLVIGPMPGQSVLEEYLRENLYVKVESLNLADVLNITAIEALEDPSMQSRCFQALGASLREEVAA